ncbi:MAG: cell division protein FtsQ [Arcticibacterium sp.]|jgi:cell division protein FtsQ
MNWNTSKIKEYGFAGLGLMVVLTLIGFVDIKAKEQRCQGVEIELIDNMDQYYISKADIEKYITRNGQEPLEGRMLSSIDLGLLEERVREINQIDFCEAYGDLKGVLHLSVKPFIPYARVSTGNSYSDKYLNEAGKIFPLSKYHSARVLLLSGNYFRGKKDLNTEKSKSIMELIHTIKNDSFWNAQLSQMDVEINGEIKFVPVLGNQIIEFGQAENIDQKLKKLKVFYKQIAGVKGWDEFSKVKIQYANQVVCE